jgi:hypothetical protein
MSEYRLSQEIIKLSVADVWDLAKLEWALHEIYETDEPETCLCGHFPIIEICTLINNRNRNFATVGNCCVKKFIGLPSDKIFQAVKRIRKDNEKSLNAEAIQHAHLKGWINDWEKAFYINIMRKRSLTRSQIEKKIQVNEKMLLNIRRAKIGG